MHSLLSFVSLSIFSLLANARVYPRAPYANSSCKAVPGSPQWPADSAWQALSVAVGGRLSQPPPPASACHSDQPNYDPEACSTIRNQFRTGSFHSNHPTSSMWQNYNNYSCLPDANAPCSSAGYPVFVVAAQNANDVKAAVDFARENNVRLNIKSTGHDFLGRSIQPNSLSIWTHNMKGTKWYTSSYTPEGCRQAIQGPAVTAGAGNQWGDLTGAASSREVMLVAGASRTVSLGGFLSNGGHGSLSAKFGLGADMVLEIELVTADGRIIKANECQNQDYFWAMRGGGGSTYGVAVAYTLQAIRTVPTSRWNGRLNSWDQIIYMHQQWPKLAAVGVSGYINGYPARSQSASLSMTMPNATSSTSLESILDPILNGMGEGNSGDDEDRPARGGGGGSRDDDDRVLRRRRSLANQGSYSHFQTWAEAESQPGIFDADEVEEAKWKRQVSAPGFPGTGQNKIITSWLWSTEDCQSPNMPTALRGAFTDSSTQLLNDMTMGVGTWNTPYMRGGGNAVNPAFRTATMRPAAELQWAGSDPATLQQKKADAIRFGTSLKSLSPNGGTYANEADPDFPDWQHAFWGSNYERLIDIKRKVDPQGVFYCRACVGSELWEDNAGMLCKK